jgi:hypothetical protein
MQYALSREYVDKTSCPQFELRQKVNQTNLFNVDDECISLQTLIMSRLYEPPL